MTELAMPAGSIQCGLVAFREGADAIYLGLQSFSARKNATNFTIEEYSKIYRFAKDNNKKVYITINTVIYDAQINSIIKILKQIEIIGSHGLIVQDLGVAKIIRTFFPSLDLHGSTQLAVHSVEGVKAMQKLGFTRVVLSRELTISEIEHIRKECSDIELKVFIHGALCYGFSGLCMASRIITKRSANAGACAQICRTWFSKESENGYFFSMKDLNSAESVKELQNIKIDSLKVEGRMKSPAYVSAVTKYYRSILDNQPYQHLIEDVKATFSRYSSKGWLDNYKEESTALIDNYYPSHKGLFISEVRDIINYRNNTYAKLYLNSEIALHDGLMFLFDNEGLSKDVKFSVKALLNNNKKEVKKANKNQIVYLLLSKREDELRIGDEIFLIKKHNQDEKIINIDRYPVSKKYIKAIFTIEENYLFIKSNLPINKVVESQIEYKVQVSNNKTDYSEKIINIFKQSGKSSYEVNDIDIVNNSKIEDDNLFLSLSHLKKLRRSFYEILDFECEKYVNEELNIDSILTNKESVNLPKKELIVKKELPFFEDVPTSIEELIKIDEKYYLPLPPVFFNENEQISNLNLLIKKIENRNLIDDVYIGLNNIAHINWIKNNKIKVYADIYFYLANRFSIQTLIDLDLNFVGGYLFLETVVGDLSKWPMMPTRVEKDFIPPLFISRTNFNFDSLHNNIREDGKYYINQRDKEYVVLSNKELTYLIKRN